MKKIRKVLWKLYVNLYERTYKKNGHQIKYFLRSNKKTKKLCIVFSGFPKKGEKATYNLIKFSVKNKDYNYLYILDDMVDIPTGGSYYLGVDGDYWAVDMIVELIEKIKKELAVEFVITGGSSKGGTASLLYGLKCHADVITAGACQYYIGSYMNCDYHKESLKALTGMDNVSQHEIEKLDNIMIDTIKEYASDDSTKIYFHYSPDEHTYQEQIKFLLNDLNSRGYSVIENVEHYTNHSDVAKYYPEYFKRLLNEYKK